MGRPSSTVVIYAAVAVILFVLLLSSSPQSPHGPRRHARRLKLRSNFTFSPPASSHHAARTIPFDPVIAEIERRREDRVWEREHYGIPSSHQDAAPAHEGQPEWEDFMNAEDYVNDDEKFNLTNRLVVLFPKIDVDPADGFLSLEELTEWNLRQAEKETLHRTQRDMKLHDKNHDGLVSFEEYDKPSWAYHSNDANSEEGWWKGHHFNASDIDGDGLLNLTEFNDFMHPADSNNPKLISWLCNEEIRERDKDKDGKLNFQEYFHGLFDSIRDYNEVNVSHQSDGSMEAPAKKLFSKLDLDNDGLLSDVELTPVIGNLHPSERYYAKQSADHTLSEADTDKDGRISLKEMIDNPYVFYSAIFTDEDDYEYNDEFR